MVAVSLGKGPQLAIVQGGFGVFVGFGVITGTEMQKVCQWLEAWPVLGGNTQLKRTELGKYAGLNVGGRGLEVWELHRSLSLRAPQPIGSPPPATICGSSSATADASSGAGCSSLSLRKAPAYVSPVMRYTEASRLPTSPTSSVITSLLTGAGLRGWIHCRFCGGGLSPGTNK